jgi:hypothetical protein
LDAVSGAFKWPQTVAGNVGILDVLKENAASLARGASLLVAGMALILVGTIIGVGTSKVAMMTAGTIAFGGVCAAFLGFFLYILPPLLPPK